MQLAPESHVPKYAQIADAIRQRISRGIWPVGIRLPANEELAREFGVSRITIRQAVDQADDQRVEALTHMFSRYGYAAEEAFIRARVLYFTQIGHYTLGMRDDREMRLRLLRAYLLSFTGRQASDDEVEAFAALMRRVQPGD